MISYMIFSIIIEIINITLVFFSFTRYESILFEFKAEREMIAIEFYLSATINQRLIGYWPTDTTCVRYELDKLNISIKIKIDMKIRT